MECPFLYLPFDGGDSRLRSGGNVGIPQGFPRAAGTGGKRSFSTVSMGRHFRGLLARDRLGLSAFSPPCFSCGLARRHPFPLSQPGPVDAVQVLEEDPPRVGAGAAPVWLDAGEPLAETPPAAQTTPLVPPATPARSGLRTSSRAARGGGTGPSSAASLLRNGGRISARPRDPGNLVLGQSQESHRS